MKSLALMPALLLCCATLYAADKAGTEKLPPGASVETDPKYPPVISYTMKNGLKLLILEKKFVPTVSFAITFRVGNVDCPSGKTGLAHVFEHMAFKGTKTMNTTDYKNEKLVLDKIEVTAKKLIAEESLRDAADQNKLDGLRKELADLQKEADSYIVNAELVSTFEKLGANGLNAYTSLDETVYHMSMPASRLEAWMVLESDRFKNPVLREFYKERSVIMEERRRAETNPGRVLFENLSAAAFVAHPYHNPTLGWMDDLKKLTRTDAEGFYAKFYIPNNATLAVVGDVRPAEVIRLAEKYFGDWQTKELPNAAYTTEPQQKAAKRVDVFFDAKPAFYMGFHNPGENHPDTPALIMLSEVLSSGKTGRFYRDLVEGRQLALYADSASTIATRYPSLFIISAAPKAPHTDAELETAVWDEIEAIKKTPPDAWDMEKILNNYEASMIRGLEANMDFAISLSRNDRLLGDWKYNWKLLDLLRKVKPEDVSAAARKYLTRDNYTVVGIAQPETATAAPKGGEAK
ncbi:MAG: pitrilysin family protein [Elusimicrobia bacterium]|nr:pitrilysin family protein [Elusimicrobiota bacterium]